MFLQSQLVVLAPAAIGAILGAFGTLAVQLLLEERRKEQRKRRIRLGLRFELLRFLSYLDELEKLENKQDVEEKLYRASHLSTTFYDSNVGQIPILSPNEVSLLVATYDTVTSTNRMLRAVSEQKLSSGKSVNVANISGHTSQMRPVVKQCLEEIESNLDDSDIDQGEWENVVDPR